MIEYISLNEGDVPAAEIGTKIAESLLDFKEHNCLPSDTLIIVDTSLFTEGASENKGRILAYHNHELLYASSKTAGYFIAPNFEGIKPENAVAYGTSDNGVLRPVMLEKLSRELLLRDNFK